MQRFRFYVPAGVLLPLLVLALATLAAAGASTASADTRAISTVTAAPRPVHGASATITVFFTANGIPTAGPGPITQAFVDGQECNWSAATVVFSTLSFEVPWPPHGGGPACFQENPTVIICADICSKPFQFTGDHASAIIDFTVPPDVPLVTVHFQSGGRPAPVELTAIEFRAGTSLCFSMGGSVPVPDATAFVTPWSENLTGPCTAGGPQMNAIADTADYGELTGAFMWEGADADAVIEVPVTATPSPTPQESVSPTSPPPSTTVAPTPAELPEAGGPPVDQTGGAGLLLWALALLVATAAAFFVSARVRQGG